jgi:hypothetical protein
MEALKGGETKRLHTGKESTLCVGLGGITVPVKTRIS